ncbi:phosphoribosylaminoimidazolesuccinocarboxamide synthase, partial [Rickettsiaceae bacterium]|nr:phosphoribosylaminoimidazolesuccinocarboxamide synthase [Rickettsiaceae bacterium]
MREKIYTGSTKTLCHADEDHALVMSFNDNLKHQKKESEVLEISGKGAINNNISCHIMQKLDMIGVDNHLIKKANMHQQLVHFVDVYPIRVHVSSVACDRYVTDFGMEKGFVFDSPVIDFRVKNRELNYPVINEFQIINFGWLTKDELKDLKIAASRVYDFLSGLFASRQIRLVDAHLEFGRAFMGEDFATMLVDEISPDTCRLWDMDTNEKLCYEAKKEDIIRGYREVQ